MQLKPIPRPEDYRGGILKRYRENFPPSPLPWIIRACTLIFYPTLAYWLWIHVRL